MTEINRIAAQDLGRIAAFSDAIFAVATTLLVLDIHVPRGLHTQAELLSKLAELGPEIVTWLLSFMTLGIFWVGQQTHLNHVAHADRNPTWLHLVFLAFVTLLPFSTRLLSEYFHYGTTLLIYWLNILLCGLGLLGCTLYAARARLIKADAPTHFSRAFTRRIVVSQLLYAFGAAIGFFSVPASIGFIALVQLNFVIAPRIPYLRRI